MGEVDAVCEDGGCNVRGKVEHIVCGMHTGLQFGDLLCARVTLGREHEALE